MYEPDEMLEMMYEERVAPTLEDDPMLEDWEELWNANNPTDDHDEESE